MDKVTEEKKPKRPSKGMRKHTRKMKQESRKANIPDNTPKKPAR